MVVDKISYELLSMCLDDVEPLFVMICNVVDYKLYIDSLRDLVNDGFVKCKLKSEVISEITSDDIVKNIALSEFVEVDGKFVDGNWDWDNSLLFYATDKGLRVAKKMFEEAKRRCLEIYDIIDTQGYGFNSFNKISTKIRPYDGFGDWILACRENKNLIGFREDEDDENFYCYNPLSKEWDWIDFTEVKYEIL